MWSVLYVLLRADTDTELGYAIISPYRTWASRFHYELTLRQKLIPIGMNSPEAQFPPDCPPQSRPHPCLFQPYLSKSCFRHNLKILLWLTAIKSWKLWATITSMLNWYLVFAFWTELSDYGDLMCLHVKCSSPYTLAKLYFRLKRSSIGMRGHVPAALLPLSQADAWWQHLLPQLARPWLWSPNACPTLNNFCWPPLVSSHR